MTGAEFRGRCLDKPCVSAYLPFGPSPVCFRVGGHIFAQLYDAADGCRVSLKCEPVRADFYRQQFPGVVVRGYHCPRRQQPYWNTLPLDGLEHDILLEMLDHAYTFTVSRLTRRERAALIDETGGPSCP